MTHHFQRAILLFGQHRYALAESECREGLTLDPENIDLQVFLSLCLAAQNKGEAALDVARAVVMKAPELPETHYALAFALNLQKQEKEARAALEESLRIDPEYELAWQLLARFELAKNKPREAMQACEHALQLDPHSLTSRLTMVHALTLLNRDGEARQLMEETLATAPEASEVHTSMGFVLLRANDPFRALRHFQESLRLDPNDDRPKYGMTEALKAQHLPYRTWMRVQYWLARYGRLLWFAWLGLMGGYWAFYQVAPAMAEPMSFLPVLCIGIILGLAIVQMYMDGLSTLVLQFHPVGRHTLNWNQKCASWWTILSLLGIVASAAMGLMSENILWIAPGIFSLIVGFQAYSIYDTPPSRFRSVRIVVLTLTTLSFALGVVLFARMTPDSSRGLLEAMALVMVGLAGMVFGAMGDSLSEFFEGRRGRRAIANSE